MANSMTWQHPFVSVFKQFGAETGRDAKHEGDVMSLLDKEIGKKVLRVWGNIPSTNFLQMPRKKTDSLGLTGRFLYVQLKVFPPKLFTFHLEVQTTGGNVVHVSVGNLFKRKKEKEPQGYKKHVQLTWEPEEPGWTMLCLDLPAIVEAESGMVHDSLKSLQLCSYMLLRGAYTSDIKYTPATLPRDMALPRGTEDNPLFRAKWLPQEPADPTPKSPKKSPLCDRGAESVSSSVMGTPARTPASITGHPVRVERHSAPKPRPPSAGGGSPGHVSFADVSPGTAATVLGAKKASAIRPDPVMELQHVMGMSGEHTRALAWCPGTAEAVFVSNNLVVAQDTVTGVQRFFMGHTAPVVALAFSGDGQLMATAQEGKTALVRLWNMATGQCAAILCGHSSGLAAVDVSQDGRAVVAVGLDAYKRQTLVVWDVSRVLQGDKASPIVKHTTDFNVRCVKFSPFEEDRLWTCGVDSIRCYRLKNGQLRGISVQLGEHRHTKRVPAGPYADDLMRNTFTDLAFEAGHGLMELHEKHIFVASVSGAVFQLNYGRRCLECVYQLHNAAINSLVVSEGFCVTASDDKFLRVWPVDFTDFFLEAEHEAPITSVGVSGDGLQLAVGTENGSVGLLDIPTHKYATLLRSHTKTVHAVAVDSTQGHLCTAAADGSIRIWDATTYQQLLEFLVPGEVCHSCQYHPHLPLVACGFGGGLVRIFSVAETRMVHEHKQHKGAVRQVLFTPDGSKLFTAGDEGNLCVFDCDQNFLPIKYLATALPSNHAAMAIAPNGALLASLGVDASFVLLFDAVTLAPHSRMDLADATIANLAFSPNSEQLLVTTTDLRLERYDIATGRYLAGAGCVHQTSCDTLVLDSSGSFVFTGGHDKLLKVWPFHLERHPSKPPPSQSFCGHSDAVSTIALDEARRQVITTGPGNTVYVWRFDGVPEGAGLSGSDGDVESAEVPRAVPPTPSARAALQAAAESEPASPDAAVQKEEASSEHASPDATVQKAEASSEPSEEAPSAPMLRKMMMVGYTGFDQGHDNIAWDPTAGVLAYPIHTAVMMEELNTRQQRHLSGHTAPVTCLAISAAAGLLASGDAGGSIIMWLLATGDMVGTLDITGAITSLSFNPTGRHLACFSGGSEPMAAVWAVQNTEAVATAPTAQAVRGVAWRPGSALTEFITVGATELVVWTLEESSATDPMLASHTIQLPVPADDPGYAYTTLAVLDHTTVVVGDTAGGLWRVDVQVGAIEWHLGASIAAATDGPVQTLWARKAGKMVTGGGSSLKIWVERVPGAHEDAGAQPWLEAWDVQLDGGVVACVLDDMGDEGIAATTSGTIWFLNLSEHGAMPLMGGHPTTVTGVCVSDTAELMATACADGVLRVWETERFAKQMQFEMPGAACTAVALSPGAAQAAVGYSSGALCIYDLDHIAVVGDCAAHHAPVVGVVFPFVHEPKCVLSGSADGHLVVTDAVGMSTVATSDALTCYSWPMEALLALPDHHMSSDTTRRVLAVWADRLEVFELTLAGSYLEVVPVGRSLQLTGGGGDGGKTVVALATSQPYIALFTSPATQGRLLFFDTETSAVVRALSLHLPVTALAPSPDGARLAVAFADGSVRTVGYGEALEGAHGACDGQVTDAVVDALAFVGPQKLVGGALSVLHVWALER